MVAPLSRIEVISPIPVLGERMPVVQERISSWRSTCDRVCRYTLFVVFPMIVGGFTAYEAIISQSELDRSGLLVMTGFCVTLAVCLGARLRINVRR